MLSSAFGALVVFTEVVGVFTEPHPQPPPPVLHQALLHPPHHPPDPHPHHPQAGFVAPLQAHPQLAQAEAEFALTVCVLVLFQAI